MSKKEREDVEVGGSTSEVVFFRDSHTEEETGGRDEDEDAEILFGRQEDQKWAR